MSMRVRHREPTGPALDRWRLRKRQLVQQQLRVLCRRGLAPLELVLSLPLLLFVMALIINFGVLACWKVRADSVGRQAVWRQRWDRRGASDPLPASWPTRATPPNVSGGAALFSDPFSQHQVVRGPLIGGQGGGTSLNVDQDLLDVTKGVQTGNAQIQVTMPLLPNLNRVTFNVQHPMLSGRWQFDQMGLPDNVWRRIPTIYPQLATPFIFVPQERVSHQQAANLITSAPFRGDLFPLDRDDEFYNWYTVHPSPNPDYRPPDFHPRVIRDLSNGRRCTLPGRYPPPPQPTCLPACELDPTIVQQSYVVAHLIPDIRRVPETMKRAWIRLYQDQINYYQSLMPPNTAEVQRLQNLINTQLQPFVTQ